MSALPSAPGDIAEPAARRSVHFSAEEREAAILSLMKMTRAIARGMAKFARNAEIGDCFNDGCIGVIRAVDSYDPARGVPLGRYARPIITGAMLNGIRERDPVSDVVRRHERRSQEWRYALAQERSSIPTLVELERADPQLRTTHLVTFRSTLLSLDARVPLRRLGYTSRIDAREPADRSNDPAHVVGEKLERAERIARIKAAIAVLPQQQREVVSKIFFGGYTASALAREIDRTPQRVTQIRGAALTALREQLATSL